MKSKIKSVLVAMLALTVFTMNAETNLKTPKNEFRSTWISTVWGIDWPTTKGYTATHAKKQQEQMVKILDSLAVNNFNAVCFQVRGMSDAMYQSSYEPWSQYLTGTRGKAPTWDPLAFVVDECHKRGMECHAWVNPYRFNTSSSSTGAGDATGYYEKGWLIKNPDGYSILNPSKAEVQDHIVKICKEITEKYDIDGMLFDDYYYNRAALDKDLADYNAYKNSGGTLSQEDWRRANVHNLMSKLYKMFQEVKPWIRFGQAPPGGTFNTKALADKYGIDPCPSGSENCYDSQYIDIMGWLKDGIIDYISPQVYWAIGYNTADYGKMVPWWGTIANKFGRHLFVSQDISYVSSTDGAGMLPIYSEVVHSTQRLSTGSCSTFGEVEDQIMLNRTSSLNGSFGSIFFSSKSLYGITGTTTLASNLKNSLYQLPALPPAMTWKTTTNPGKVSGLNFDGTNLTWTAMSATKNKRYTVYAIPTGLDVANFNKDLKYLVTFTYNNSYTVPEEFRVGYNFAVCVYDRFGNEWDAAIYKKSYTSAASAPAVTYPATGAKLDKTFSFKWNAVSGAKMYAVDVAADSKFTNILKTVQTTGTTLSSDKVYKAIDKNKTTYWRVRAIADGKNDGVSEVRTLTYELPVLSFPAQGATGLDPKVNFKWKVPVSKGSATLIVASDEKFTDIVMTVNSSSGSYQTPMCTLKQQATYYARLSYNGNLSPIVSFTTKAMTCVVPTIKYPTNGGTLWSNNSLLVTPQEGVEQVEVLIDSTTDFAGTTRCRKVLKNFVFAIPAADITFTTKKTPLEDGKTYYVKARVTYKDGEGKSVSTDYCNVVSFVYSSKTSAIDNVAVAADVKLVGNKVVINADKETSIKVSAVSMIGSEESLYAGQASSEEISLEGLANGMYIIKVVLDNEVRTIKYVK